MKKNFRVLAFISIFISASFLSAQVINPVEGTWANMQTLVIDLPETSNAFFSLSGEDPEASGLAYDGPVLLEMEGDVTVNIVIVDENGNKTFQKVNYNVKKVSLPENEAERNFIESVIASGIVDYSCGDVFSIPESLSYSFGNVFDSTEPGKGLSLSKDMVIHRNLPCTVSDGTGLYRFIISVNPVVTGIFTRKDLPFEIKDWETFIFNDKSFIYKIDDEWWGQPKEKRKLDRSKNHMISWQSVDYSPENIIKFYIVPPKPELISQVQDDGVVSVSAKGQEGYKFGIINEDNEVNELFDSITVDTFQGDNFSGKITCGLFYDSVYHGRLAVPFNVHKRKPLQPVITPSVEGKFIRSSVKISVKSPENNPVYAAVTGPVILNDEYSVEAQENLFELSSEKYVKMRGKAFNLSPSSEGACAYRVRAYCIDSSKNISNTTEYTVIIDQCNYYINGNITNEELLKKADGSREYPFSNFRDLIPLINKSRFVHVRVSGEVYIPNEKIILTSNCHIEGEDSSRLIFGPGTNITVRNSSLSVSNVLMTLSEPENQTETASIFQLERAVLFMENSELSAAFGKTGTVINSDSSVVNINNSGLTATAENYTSLIASVGSKIYVKASRLTSCADTAVNFSCQGGLFEVRESKCKVVGTMGRIAELFDTHSTIVKNTLNGDLKNGLSSNKAVYMDRKNYSVEYEQNVETGF